MYIRKRLKISEDMMPDGRQKTIGGAVRVDLDFLQIET